MFSNLSLSSISFATETPSLVTLGAPNDLSNITFLPLGPSVTYTALASASTPAIILVLASDPNVICFADILFSLLNYTHDV